MSVVDIQSVLWLTVVTGLHLQTLGEISKYREKIQIKLPPPPTTTKRKKKAKDLKLVKKKKNERK